MKTPALDLDTLIWRAREAAVGLVTASLEGLTTGDPSLASKALQAAQASVPPAQLGEFQSRLLLCLGEIVGTSIAVSVSLAGGDTTGPVEVTGHLMLVAWQQMVPGLLEGERATDDLAGAGETLMGELDDWLPRQPPPDPT